MTMRQSARIGFLGACTATLWCALAHAQIKPADVQCKKTETQAECHDRLKCKADEELTDCQKRLLRCKSSESIEDCVKRAGTQGAKSDGTGQQNNGDRDARDRNQNGRERDARDDDGDRRDRSDRGDRGNRDDGGDRDDRRNRDDGRRDRDDGGSARNQRGARASGHGGFVANKTFGLGIELGEPTGLNGKVFVTKSAAIDFGVGYIDTYYYGGGEHIYADFLWHPTSLASTPSFELPLYIGAGLRFWDFDYCYMGVCNYRGSAFGIRVPFGIAFDFNNVKLDIFLQLVPALDFLSNDYYNRYGDREHAGLDGSVGFRYWFK
jgi:hypothetical protein